MIVGMATPINSQIYLLPVSGPRNNYSRTRNHRNRILTLKVLQFFLVCISLLLFVLGTADITKQMADPFTCVTFGICLIFPIFVLTGTTEYSSKRMIIFNFCGGLLLFVIGLILAAGCASSFALVIINAEMDNRNEFYINMKLASGIVTVMNAILYFTESTMMMLYNCNNIII